MVDKVKAIKSFEVTASGLKIKVSKGDIFKYKYRLLKGKQIRIIDSRKWVVIWVKFDSSKFELVERQM